MTRDQKDPTTTTKVRAVEKIRVADMNVYSPKRLFDWRVSVSLEIPSACGFTSFHQSGACMKLILPGTLTPAPVPEGALNSTPARVRYKDRISYSHQLCQVDLTKVQTGSSPVAPPTHELEVEIRNAKQLLEEAAKDQRGEENRYLEMVQVLLNNIRGFFCLSPSFLKPVRHNPVFSFLAAELTPSNCDDERRAAGMLIRNAAAP